MKNLRKTSTIFELSILNLRYMPTFMKVWEKKVLDAFFTDFWLIEAKKGKILGNKYDFWTLQPNIRWYTNFHENLEAKNFDWFLTDFLTNRDKN